MIGLCATCYVNIGGLGGGKEHLRASSPPPHYHSQTLPTLQRLNSTTEKEVEDSKGKKKGSNIDIHAIPVRYLRDSRNNSIELRELIDAVCSLGIGISRFFPPSFQLERDRVREREKREARATSPFYFIIFILNVQPVIIPSPMRKRSQRP